MSHHPDNRNEPSDPRLELIAAWLRDTLGLPVIRLAPASTDASFRRYFRVWLPRETVIAMDAPPEHEDCGPFVRVAGLLRGAGLNAPEVLASDLEAGFLLLTDLGERTYLDVIDRDDADRLMGDAIDALVRWQCATEPDALPPYDRSLLERELDLFPEWYLGRHLGVTLDAAQREVWEGVRERLVRTALEQPQVFVHRDYMPRNLMVTTPNPGIIDFQDAVVGPVAYDMVSLVRDAFVSWDGSREEGWFRAYWERARAAGVPVPGSYRAFRRDLDWTGLQRHLKVLGIFARLNYRDGKPGYLPELPRFLDYARRVAGGYPELRPLAVLLDALGMGTAVEETGPCGR